MPPKKQVNKKQLEKEKQKIIEDKTFGLKNKNKSAKVQKYIATVKKTVDESMKKKLPKPPSGADHKKTKAEVEAEKKAELAQLFKITQARVPPGADPKSVLCEFFKQGMCTKGDKCKFSHDLNVARRGAKIDIYTDQRDVKDASEAEKKDDMESGNWTQEQLEKVVKEREDTAGRRVQSDIICKYFLDAVESRKYGWFWACPNGGDKCQYRHALPPGYVLKTEKKQLEEDKPDETPLEEIIEEERKKLTTRTQLTKETFLKWKEDREKKRQAAREEEERQHREALKSGKTQMSGREMFAYHPEFFVDDDEAMGADEYVADTTDEIPETVLTVTGTSIVATQKGGGKPLQPIHITESLFTDAPLPEDDDDEDEPPRRENGSSSPAAAASSSSSSGGAKRSEHENGDDNNTDGEEEEEEEQEEQDEAEGAEQEEDGTAAGSDDEKAPQRSP